MHGWGFWGMGWWMWLVWILVIAAVVWGVIAALRQGGVAGQGGRREERRPSAREILEERLARGEISEEEFERKKELLDNGG